MDFTVPFIHWLKLRRKQLDLTQGDLARRVSYSPETIRKIEAGTRRPSRAMADQLAEALEIPDSELQRFVAFAIGIEAHRRPSNLPAPTTPLIGRDKDVATARKFLRDKSTRLLTFIGPPGVGKTRLALQVAWQARDDFADGVWFVPLGSISDPQLVIPAITEALELPNSNGPSPLAQLKAYLREKTLLLVLDNFEHLLDAESTVSELLTVSPGLRIGTTSRVALHTLSERLFEVQPLAASDAMQLFVQRAKTVKPDFNQSTGNVRVITEICRQLDGLPLAIELAVARLRLFSPEALLAQLNSAALDVLSGGPYDLPTRQRTLRTAIAWSYQLLTSGQQRLLRTLSVFAGGCARESAQSVAGYPRLFDTDLQTLIDSSLIQRIDNDDSEMRFSLLNMIREYAIEQLAACSEVATVSRQHAAYYLEYVKSKAPDVFQEAGSPIRSESGVIGKGEWLKALKWEHDNLRAALTWSLGTAKDEGNDVNMGAQLALWLFDLWLTYGPWNEATYWMERALAQLQPSLPLPLKAGLLTWLGSLIAAVGDPVRAERLVQEALTIYETLDDPQAMAVALGALSDANLERNHLKESELASQKKLAIGRAIGDSWHVAIALLYLAQIALCQKEFARVAFLCEEGLRIDLGNEVVLNLKGLLGELACYQGDFDRAEILCQEMLASFQKAGWSHGIATILHSLGDIALFRGDIAQAIARFVASLQLFNENGNKQRAAWCMSGLAAAAAAHGNAPRAVTLWAGVETIYAAIGSPRPALRYQDYRESIDTVWSLLDRQLLSAARAAGKAMSFNQAVEYALAT